MIGRSGSCHLQLDAPTVSSEHALLRWRGDVWELQDLHSRNGTYVNGQLLEAGSRIGLDSGARLSFGSRAPGYLLVGGPPIAHALALDGEHESVEAHDGLLVLPSADEPELVVLQSGGAWQLERADGVEAAVDGMVVNVASRAWRLRLPQQSQSTADADDASLTLATIVLEFTLDPAGELRELAIKRGRRRLPLKLRSFMSTLLALARIRARERERPEPEQGWISQDELVELLGYNEGRLHVEVHRNRRHLIDVGVIDGAGIIERQTTDRKLRIGDVQIELRSDPSPTDQHGP